MPFLNFAGTFISPPNRARDLKILENCKCEKQCPVNGNCTVENVVYQAVNNFGSSIVIYDNRIVILHPQVYVGGSQIVVQTIALELFYEKVLNHKSWFVIYANEIVVFYPQVFVHGS